MASPTKLTSSSSSTRQWSHDIFLSFRGEDTRFEFTHNLYTALISYGLNTFFDTNLERGEEISKELLITIELSMISIVVLSENYASSTWCLDELVKILECRKTGRILKVYPIFYKVTPSEVRKKEGKFGKALDNHETKFKDKMEKVTRWREALTEVADLSGFEYKNGVYESEFIKRIIEEILKVKSIHVKLAIPKYLVGVDSRVEAIESHLDMESKGVFMVGIHGLGGVGKTTMSIAVYDKIRGRFQGSCFLENVRERSKTDAGIIQLQQTLLTDTLRSGIVKVNSVRVGTTMIQERLCNKKILLILDDVDQSEEIENLLGYCNWFASESRVIITTRDKQVLADLERYAQIKIYEVPKLDPCDACDLFNMHAFRKNEPKQEYSNLAEHIISSADGLPLALKIMGSDLYNKSIDEWACASKKYKKIPHEKILDKLKISYNGLGEEEKVIFLDIACFFRGFNKDKVVKILEACQLYPYSGIRKLIDKCLITVDIGGILCMHNLLQQMGREIVRRESKELENRSRIWCHEDAYKLLTENMGSNKIRGIMWYSPEPRLVKLQANAFKNMRNLKFLLVENVRISRELKYLPNELRLLQWSEYDFSLPLKFYPPNLVVLNMPNSQIRLEKLLKQGRTFEALKNVNLCGCKFITELPSLFCAPNIKNLDMRDCVSLTEVHESFGYLDKLERWDLTNCRDLKILPSLLELRSLKYFNLSYCRRLEKFPAICAPNLESLSNSFCTNLREVHESVGQLDQLKSWSLESCRNLEILPSLLMLRSLQSLTLKNCGRLEKFPDIHPEMKYLQRLNMANSGIREWPSSFMHLTKGLHILELSNNENLWNFLHSRNKLQLPEEIDVPTTNPFDGFSGYGFRSLEYLWLYSWDGDITELDFQYFLPLRELHIDDSNIISIPQSISGLTKLESIHIAYCKRLREIPTLPQSVRSVYVSKCPSVDPQSFSRLLIQIGEILGILPNRFHEGARSNISMDPIHDSKSKSEYEILYRLTLPVTEIPKDLKFNHQTFGNSVSFWVGKKFSKLAICIAFRTGGAHMLVDCGFIISINGCKQIDSVFAKSWIEEELWLLSISFEKLNKRKLSEQNHIEVEFIAFSSHDLLGNHTDSIKWLGVNAECTCYPQNSDVPCLPLPCAMNGCGSSSILNDTELPPLLPASSISYASDSDHRVLNNGRNYILAGTGFQKRRRIC
ncbi:disease resistance protein RUN1-like [Quercus robur]|uniref:disease resistance protein RUN1-like n=1 Tax=Quercus robur TaxID=38942 RepID=UPI00216172D5|nr:disease resistance protein RUN1-like [Quercus robur]